MKTQFVRSTTDKMVGGVCGGLAQTYNIDPTLVRLGFVALALLGGGAGLLIYLVLWLVMPTIGADSPAERVLVGVTGGSTVAGEGRNRTLGLVLIGVGTLLLASWLDLSGPVFALLILGAGWYLLRQRR